VHRARGPCEPFAVEGARLVVDAAEKVGPIAAELGLSMPEIEERSVDRILTPV
jgi:hypothetical protein